LRFVWALLWWVGGGLHEIERHVAAADQKHVVLLFAAGSCLLFSFIVQVDQLADRTLARSGAAAVMIVLAVIAAAEHAHPLAGIGAAAWPVAFAVHLWILRRHDDPELGYLEFMHAGQLLLFCALASWELSWNINRALEGARCGGHIAWAIVPAAALSLLATRAERLPGRCAGRLSIYMTAAGAPLALYLCAWIVFAKRCEQWQCRSAALRTVVEPARSRAARRVALRGGMAAGHEAPRHRGLRRRQPDPVLRRASARLRSSH
jgi:hypothetical protein